MDILNVIEQLEKQRKEMNISRESIEFISLILKILKPKNVLEIGAFNGYSSLWLSLYAKNVTSLEIDKSNAELTKENLCKADCKNVLVIEGNAIESLKKLKNKFQIILIDGKKSEYKIYLELSLKVLAENGLIFVDNTISHKDKLGSFFEYLENSKLYFKELNLGKGLMIIG